MTERTIRMLAKQIAGEFYENPRRSKRFRYLHPNQYAYVNKYWPHFYDLARRMLANMLNLPGVPDHLKESITDALVEDNAKRHRPGGAVHVPQIVNLTEKEWEDVKLVDDNPQIPIS